MISISDRRRTALALTLIPALGKGPALELYRENRPFSSISAGELKQRWSWKESFLDSETLWSQSGAVLDLCEREGIHLSCWGEEHYPELLEEIYDPPVCFFSRGRPLERDFAGAALVGTRKPSGEGLSQAFQGAMDLALRECPVVSGLALGIDAAAHKGALAGGGWTVAVLASGVDRVTPRQHWKLARNILEKGGTLISEYLPGSEPQRYRYPQRNRLISGLSAVTAVVEAPEKSGALITADFALQEGRDLFIFEAGIGCGGTQRLADDGAPVLTRGREILDAMDLPTVEEPGSRMPLPGCLEEWIEQLEMELQGKALSYGGERFYGV